MSQPNTFHLSREWFNMAFENPEVKPYHTAFFFWIVDRANRSGWKDVIDIQTDFTMQTLGIGSNKTYKKMLEDLVKWKIIKWVYRSKNQYTGCNKFSICFGTFDQSTAKALPKALPKQVESTAQSSAKASPSYINLQTSKPVNLQTSKPGKIHAQAFENEKFPDGFGSVVGQFKRKYGGDALGIHYQLLERPLFEAINKAEKKYQINLAIFMNRVADYITYCDKTQRLKKDCRKWLDEELYLNDWALMEIGERNDFKPKANNQKNKNETSEFWRAVDKL